jgi:hypothetical protein
MWVTFEAPFLADRVAQRDRVHARCIAHVAARLRAAGWSVMTEVEIEGRFGPGWIDVLAFHPASEVLLVIEIKTEIADLGRVQRTLGWYVSRSASVARSFGWQVTRTQPVLLVLSTDTADRALAANRALVSHAFPMRARDLASAIADPAVAVAAGPGLAMIDPISRRGRWLLPTRIDGRRSPAAFADYAAVIRRLEGRPESSQLRIRRE